MIYFVITLFFLWFLFFFLSHIFKADKKDHVKSDSLYTLRVWRYNRKIRAYKSRDSSNDIL